MIRFLDIVLSLFFIVCLAPFFVIIAFLIALDGFPIVFRQRRNGWKGSTFWMYKFRTMKVIEDGDTEFKQASFVDERYTYIGRFLRKFYPTNLFRAEQNLSHMGYDKRTGAVPYKL